MTVGEKRVRALFQWILILNRVITRNIKCFETNKVCPSPLRIRSRAFSPSSENNNQRIFYGNNTRNKPCDKVNSSQNWNNKLVSKVQDLLFFLKEINDIQTSHDTLMNKRLHLQILTYSWVYCLGGFSPHRVNDSLTLDSHNSACNQGWCLKMISL